ncbi:MAG: tRNA 2-thiouridine(34) synthase MnmA, partial [candidate division NC10 bacterium]
MDTRVVVAMSGGVDSAVTAALLQEEGYGVVGVTLKVWGHVAETPVPHPPQSCCTPEAFEDARLMAAHLGIPHYLLNVEREFETHVITPFCQEYAVGRTPLPCAACNSEVKFGSLLRRALAWGAEFVATGHYARTGVDQTTGRILLKRGIDPDKDQSYFLYGLTQSQLRRIRFPLGTMRKGDVRALAAQKGLRVATKPDSQELCFLPEGDYRALLRERHPGAIRPGIIRDQTGQVLGTHEGIPLYTIGQRRGLKIGGRGPYYVVA